jgi:hypothetical protein
MMGEPEVIQLDEKSAMVGLAIHELETPEIRRCGKRRD